MFVVGVEVECRWFGQIARWEIEKWPQDGNLAIWQATGEGRGKLALLSNKQIWTPIVKKRNYKEPKISS